MNAITKMDKKINFFFLSSDQFDGGKKKNAEGKKLCKFIVNKKNSFFFCFSLLTSRGLGRTTRGTTNNYSKGVNSTLRLATAEQHKKSSKLAKIFQRTDILLLFTCFLTSFNSNTTFFTGNNNETRETKRKKKLLVCSRLTSRVFLVSKRETSQQPAMSEPSTTHTSGVVVAAIWNRYRKRQPKPAEKFFLPEKKRPPRVSEWNCRCNVRERACVRLFGSCIFAALDSLVCFRGWLC
jgi:hypothetical protein